MLDWLKNRKSNDADAELEEFRSIMEVPGTFEDGFSLSSLLGTVFVALIMVPGALYMELVAGIGLGGAAQWVTVLLFVEVAKRANAKLSRPQLFILFYMSGMVLGQSVHGTPLFRQFMVRSDAAVSFGITSWIPSWVAPANLDSLPRTFFQRAWLPVIGLILFNGVFGRLENMVVGYGLFRIACDIERLPFPMAPLGAQGIVAVADQVEGSARTKQGDVRWRMFCIGAGVGILSGLVYMVLPTLTGAFFDDPVMVFPIPFADLTPYTQRFLPAVATGLSFEMGNFIFGMVLPFYAMLGSFIGLIVTFIANPILYRNDLLPTWRPGDMTVDTLFSNNIDFYFAFGIGVSMAIAIYGIVNVFRSIHRRKNNIHGNGATQKIVDPKLRGDIPPFWIVVCYIVTASIYIMVCGWLIDWHRGVMIVLFFFAVIYTPLISYVSTKLEGMVGQIIEIPFVTQLAFILSGYQGVAVWFIPIPKANYATQTTFYKQAELLGCRFTSIWKSTIILFPVIFISMLVFSSFIWGLAPIPSSVYPYTTEMWEFFAKNACLVYSSTLGEFSPFQEAIRFGDRSGTFLAIDWRIWIGMGLGGIMLALFDFISAPTMLLFGVVRGLGQTMPHSVLPQFLGALIGRFYFQKRYGREWRKMIPVVGAGFFVGGGLITILAIGLVFLSKAVTTLSY